MSGLRWGIKQSLLTYVRSMPDGLIECTAGASESSSGVFAFADAAQGAGDFRFTGSVILSGHDGMMRVVIADPEIVHTEEGWLLTIADPDEPGIRLGFARIARVAATPTGGWSATDVTLTSEGADLFFGPYREGTPLDDALIS